MKFHLIKTIYKYTYGYFITKYIQFFCIKDTKSIFELHLEKMKSLKHLMFKMLYTSSSYMPINIIHLLAYFTHPKIYVKKTKIHIKIMK